MVNYIHKNYGGEENCKRVQHEKDKQEALERLPELEQTIVNLTDRLEITEGMVTKLVFDLNALQETVDVLKSASNSGKAYYEYHE